MPIAQAAHVKVEKFLDLGIRSGYQYIGLFAGRLCRISERYVEIEDYNIPEKDPLREAIALFEKTKESINMPHLSQTYNPVVFAFELVTDALSLMKNEDQTDQAISAHEFCDKAISTLESLLTKPEKVSKGEKQNLLTFFTCLERVAKEKTPNFYELRKIQDILKS